MRSSDWSSDVCSSDLEDGTYNKISQIGNVVIEDDVEIGANSVIDRATMGSAIIRQGVKLDNLIQIAHNVEIGQHTVIAAQSGISGSTKIGKNAVIGGQVGVVGHISIRSEEHTSELQSLMRISYAVFCLKKKNS